MPTDADNLNELERAAKVLVSLSGEDVDAIDIKSVDIDEAPFLAKIVSKLSPMVGNLMEQRVVSALDRDASEGFSWHRQDPGFPDAILEHDSGLETNTGYEIKAWYVLSTEITGRFKESLNLLAAKNINVVIIAWCMSHLIFGKPKIIGVLTVSGKELAESRDSHYHNPPEYLVEEPQDTRGRTANLQQSNVNGHKLQADESDPTLLEAARSRFAGRNHPPPHLPSEQRVVSELRRDLVYRLETNFAKIDRVANKDVERFKREILTSTYLGRTIAQWKALFVHLNGKDDAKRRAAENVIRALYGSMLIEEPKTAVAAESKDVR